MLQVRHGFILNRRLKLIHFIRAWSRCWRSTILVRTRLEVSMRTCIHLLFASLIGLVMPAISSAQDFAFPGFAVREIAVNGATIHTRSGGSGPAVVLLHGYGETGDMWAPLAVDLARDRTVIVPDLRGLGLSSKPAGGFDKKNQAVDVDSLLTALNVKQVDVVAHDIGNMVAYAYAATYPDKVERLVVMDAPIPGIEPWSEILLNPGVWHFNFHGPDAERLVAGRERIYFDRIWNDFTADPSKPDEATRDFFAATYAQPGGMRAGFAQFTAFSQDAKDNKIFEQVKLTMPVLAVGGEKSFGPLQAVIMRHVATNVQEAVVAGSGHWLMEERPDYTVTLIRNFLDAPQVASPVAGR
jgi:pimeloyl-ACP methyl ester carboxylesterase